MRRAHLGAVPSLGRVAIVAQIVGALAFIAVLLRSEGVHLPLIDGTSEWTLRATFSDAGGIRTGERTPVLVAGVPSGWVTGVQLRRGAALVSMRMDPAARGVIRTNATARIEPRSALQDLTVDITPGSPAARPAGPGARIPATQTLPTTTLDRVVSVLNTDTRAQLSVVLDQLARGTRGRGGTLAAAIAQLHGLLDPARAVTHALAVRRSRLSALVGSVARLSAVAQRHDVALAGALAHGNVTLRSAAREQTTIATSVRALPSTLGTVDAALRGITSLASPLVPTLGRLGATAVALPGALRAFRAVAPAASALLRRATAFAHTSGGTLHVAASVLGQLGPTAQALTPAISRLQPVVAAVNARRDGIGALGERFSGVLSTNDANGPVLRGLGTFESFNPADFGFPGATGAARATIAAQAASALTLTCLRGGLVACLVRYLVPGLPGSVR